MATVPYTPYSTVSPQAPGTPELRINAPGAAFGENVAAAIQHLGGTVEQSGNELFQRALALQDLRNEADARDATTKYMIDQGKLHADYSAKQGKDAVDGLEPYMQASQDLRTQYRGNLGNPMAQKMYDAESTNFMARNIFNAAGHAATENKLYTIGTLKSQVDLDTKNAENYSTDEGQFQRGQRSIIANTQQATALETGEHDPNSPIVKDAVMKATSAHRASQILGVGKTDPLTAMKLLQDHKTDLTEPDFQRVEGTLETKSTAVAAANIVNDVYSAHRQPDGTYDASVKQMQDEVTAKSQEMFPDNKVLPQAAIAHLDGKVNQDRYATRQDILDARQTVADAITKFQVRDPQALLALPGMDKVVEKLPPTERNGLAGVINRTWESIDKKTNQDSFLRLNGMANNDTTSFLDTDLTKEHLAFTDLKYLQGLQNKLKQNAAGDPRVERAVGWMRGAMGSQMEALGIYRRDANNKDDYDHFTGALQSALDVWQESHGKAPSYDEFTTKIAPQLLQQRTVPGFLWSSKESFFNQPAPPKWVQEHKADILAKGGAEPKEDQLNQAFIREQFIKLYGPKDTGSNHE